MRFTAEENATLGAIALIMGLASAYAQFISSGVHGWLLLIAVCLLLTLLTIGAVILVKRVQNISLRWALLIAVVASAGGAGVGYLVRGDRGTDSSGSSRPPATTGPSVRATQLPGSPAPLGGSFENAVAGTTGCVTGLRFVVDQDLPTDQTIWIMVYNAAAQTEVYPEQKLALVGGRAAVAPFPIGSRADPDGTTFEVLAVLVPAATSDRYERQAASAGTLPVETAGPPGRVLDHFSTARGAVYVPCT